MNKGQKGKKIRTFSEEEKEEIMDAEEEFAKETEAVSEEMTDNPDSQSKGSGALRAVRNFAGMTTGALNEASKDVNTSEKDNEENEANYGQDMNTLENQVTQAPSRVRDMINNMKRNDLTKSQKEREAERLSQDQGIAKKKNPKVNDTTLSNGQGSSFTQPERKTQIQDNKTLAEAGANREKAEETKEALDNSFSKPNKKESLLDRLTKAKSKKKAEKEAAKAAIKEKGALNAAAEKITGASVKTVGGYVLKIVLIIILVVLLFAFLTAIIFYFSNNYTRGETNELDAKRLDTRVARAIYALKENDAITDLYEDYISSSTGTALATYKKNLQRLVPSTELQKLRAGEDPEEAFILQDTSSWFLLYLERLSYAWGGYLDWEPEYLDDGTALCNCQDRNPNTEIVEIWREIAEQVGAEYGIDPNILLAIVDIESGGDPHAKNGTHWGLGQIGEDYTAYFEEGEEYKTWSLEQRVPEDTGSCDYYDENHQDVATMQFTYIARRLTHQMAIFLKQVKNTSLSKASDLDKKIAISYAVTGYNQGEGRIKALYEVYGDEIFTDDGTVYATKFLEHVNNRLPSGYLMIGENQANYLKLFNKFYESYSGGAVNSARVTPINWYKADEVEGNDIEGYSGVYPGPVTESVKLVSGSTEVDVINQLKEIFYNEQIEYIVNQYNRWMSKLNNYYLNNFYDKFIKDSSGNLIPELYAKDVHGLDVKDTVIKYASYIHEIVSEISTYTTEKTYKGISASEAYSALKQDLENEVNDEASLTVKEEATEDLKDLESLLGINRYEMSFEAIRTVDSNNELLENDEAIEIIEDSLSYSVPIYEYATTNVNKAYKSFFDYEIYNANNYNDDYTLKISDFQFRTKITGINTINISMKSFINNGWSQAGQSSLENRFENAFEYLYTNSQKAYNPSNHYAEVPSNLSNYFFVKNNRIYDRLVEKIYATEKYHCGECNDLENYEVVWTNCGEVSVNFTYDGLETKVIRDYYLPNLKPSKYTALKYEANFDYVSEESGSRDIDEMTPNENYYEGKVYKKILNSDGTDSGEREYVRSIYKKEISRYTSYAKEKVRNMTISTRGIN